MRRRDVLMAIGGGIAAVMQVQPREAEGRDTPTRTPRLAIGNYGMKSVPLEEAIRRVAAMGFGGFECCANAEWDSEPSRMSVERRRIAASLLADGGLRLVAVMEDLPPQADDGRHRAALDRLRQAMELGRDLTRGGRPLVQTVLGGGEWDRVRGIFRDRLGSWVDLARDQGSTVAIKPHRFGAMSTPGQAAWLLGQLGSPDELRIVYDYSHYAYRDLSIEDTVRQADGLVAYVALKDAVVADDKVSFALPGTAGTVDHAAVRRALEAAGYTGDYCCEVSGQVWRQAGYDPFVAAETCHRLLAPLFAS